MHRHKFLWPLALACLLGTGCVERRFLITSDPPGAIVQANGKTIGATPIDIPYTYYGKYRFTLLRDGYETLVVDQPVTAPVYAYPPLDFITENLVPFRITDIRKYHYKMEPLKIENPDAVLNRSEQLRVRGRQIGAPPPGYMPGPEQPHLGTPAALPALPPGTVLPSAPVFPTPPGGLQQVPPPPGAVPGL